jgi:hypothetical protein
MSRSRLWAVCLLAATACCMAVATTAQAHEDWSIKGSVVNETGSEVDNCYGGSGFGCVSVGPDHVSLDDASEPIRLPTSPLANGNDGSFSFSADGFWEGADMYALYTMPEEESSYEITAEDDVSVGGGTDGDYAACSQSRAQGSPYVCSAVWGGTNSNMTPTYTFSPSASAPTAAAGQVCSGEMGGSSAGAIDCNETGQFGTIDPSGESDEMLLSFSNENASSGLTITAQGNPGFWRHTETCAVAQWAQQCLLQLSGAAAPWHIILSPTNPSSPEQWYGIQVVGEAQADEDYGPSYLPTWPPGESSTAAAPQLSALSISPVQAGSAATITYRDSRPATTVFTLARAAGPTWVPLGHQTVETSLTLAGTRHGGDCRRDATAGSPRCVWRMAVAGQFAHSDRAGPNVVHFPTRLAGRPLRPGLYRLTARARARSTASLSRPRTARFRIVR